MTQDDRMETIAAETDNPTVCITHGRFIPCRNEDWHHFTDNPYWVKSVRDFQGSDDPNLTWEPATLTITDPALIRATDEPDERTTPAPVGAAVALDLDAVEAEFLRQCGGCDAGLMVGCTCSQRDFRPTMLALVAEVRRLTAEAATQREWFEAADAAAERRLDQSIAWMERAEAAEAEVVTLRANVAAVEGLAERLEREARNGYAARLRAALATTGEGQ